MAPMRDASPRDPRLKRKAEDEGKPPVKKAKIDPFTTRGSDSPEKTAPSFQYLNEYFQQASPSAEKATRTAIEKESKSPAAARNPLPARPKISPQAPSTPKKQTAIRSGNTPIRSVPKATEPTAATTLPSTPAKDPVARTSRLRSASIQACSAPSTSARVAATTSTSMQTDDDKLFLFLKSAPAPRRQLTAINKPPKVPKLTQLASSAKMSRTSNRNSSSAEPQNVTRDLPEAIVAMKCPFSLLEKCPKCDYDLQKYAEKQAEEELRLLEENHRKYMEKYEWEKKVLRVGAGIDPHP